MKLFKTNTIAKRYISVGIVLLVCAFSGLSQGITTANEFFKEVSDKYASFKDYSASVDIIVDKKDMSATVLYLAPDKMRMDFTEPASQTIVYDGKKLICYLPENASVLTQESANTNPATAEGLSLLRRYYSVSYEESQSVVPLEEGSDEMVVKLILWRRSASESFRYLKMSVNPTTKLIRRIIAVTPGGTTYQFDFKNYEINQGLTEKRFQYDIPSGANSIDNFLYSE
ncbi:MAG: outer membrane lipoprotein carrier protein LolA [Treponema sp.]|uniref:LolA family protein n=1 Tax=Treponema sp. TaxID=166 RepID=UPI001B6DF738|nr:outer membrane lipoprotein carrier protein LolA [Treponema sp.]MBP5402266.1 outer membrane lipoprotein carrier protein LolA [Treponema sp.]MBR5933236.1 outer membrane lipoprotein carrier protein LolA [Treponema sp.]